LEILYFEKLDSTHKFLLKNIKEEKLFAPIMIVADEQTNGIGTRGKSWQSLKGNLFFSMAVTKEYLPKDLPLQSVSIYFGYIFKEILKEQGSKVWLKWPNDFYLDDKKVGGVLSQLVRKYIIVSIGLNIINSPKNFKNIDISIEKNKLIEEFILKVKQVFSWKSIFSKYQVEFSRSKSHKTTYKDGKKISLREAKICSDGSIQINGKRIYSKDG
jgi:BirA family biotin operon repressor/biotin-[acetyl-CoA-carboxylase] ligase